jgi:alginate O-acetyltransferase complex protein AlgF
MQLQGFRKFSGLAGVLLLAVVGYSAQAQQAGLLYDPEPPADSAYVRLIITSRDGPMDVWVDGKKRVQKLTLGEASEFMVLSAGPHTIALHPAGKTTAQLTTQLDVTKGRALTVAFTSMKANTAPLLFEDKTNSNKLKALLAVYHLDAQAGPLDILTADGNTKVFTGISYGEPASIQVNPITVELMTTKTGDKSPRARASVAMTQGGTYSVFLMADGNGKMTAKVGLNKIERYTGK